MTDGPYLLKVEVQNGVIVITMPGTTYTVTYYKPENSPQLLSKNISHRDDPHVAKREAAYTSTTTSRRILS